MPRGLRIQCEGAAYHVMSRGNHGQSVFRNQRDREVFLETLDEACDLPRAPMPKSPGFPPEPDQPGG